jgi:hypothetical protein
MSLTSDYGSTRAYLLAWYKKNPVAKILWEEESNIRPSLLLSKKKESVLEHHGLARGWPMVNPSGVAVPMVGWK